MAYDVIWHEDSVEDLKKLDKRPMGFVLFGQNSLTLYLLHYLLYVVYIGSFPIPVTIRLLDPPLHEFLPKEEKDILDLSKEMGVTVEKLKKAICINNIKSKA